MSASDLAVILRWTVALWALGWLMLPASSRLFAFLPDAGLAAGRVVAVVLVSLVCFWGASLHLVPLNLAPVVWVLAPLVIAIGWRKGEWRGRVLAKRRTLLVSDLVFLAGWAFLLWVRLRHPETNEFEKPMDMALLSSAMRAVWLPFENPWFSGTTFTNYYYFGPLMGGTLARTLATPPFQAYNLVEPLFGAFFLSVLWSLGAALGKGARVGVAVMLLVGLGGHFEPLRQIAQTHKIWPLDWWATSRVIENTINEYPAFTLMLGDLHAHLYAFCLAATHFCLCFGILKTASARVRSGLLLLSGALLGTFALANTWDVPFYGLVCLGCVIGSFRRTSWNRGNWMALIGAVLLVPLVALPYFLRFKPQVSGAVFEFWVPAPFSLTLLWGSWWVLGCLALGLPMGEEKPSEEAIFRRLLVMVGAMALVFPFFFYIRGAFGDGDYRHQDTVFKFGLQAWLLLGTGIAAEVGFRFSRWWRTQQRPMRVVASLGTLIFAGIIALAPASVFWTRTVRDAPQDEFGKHILSLNAARFLSQDDQAGIEWLRMNAKPGESIVEAVVRNNDGTPGGDYNGSYGRISAFSGVPAYLGWSQHVMVWGTPWSQVVERGNDAFSIFQGGSDAEALAALKKTGATYVFLGQQEWMLGQGASRLAHGLGGLTSVQRFGENSDATQILRFGR